MTRRRAMIFGIVTGLSFLVWACLPHVYLATLPLLEEKGEDGGHWLRARLVSCGQRAVGPTIATIREDSPWQRNYCYLPLVLRDLGEPAHRRLLQAVDDEVDPYARDKLISALATGFSDYSRLRLWITEAVTHRGHNMDLGFLQRHLECRYPDAPPLLRDGNVTDDFVIWWNARQHD
jgi:hypothetical protein